jgi:fido (protein-threonine AMPylation protein)
MTDHGYTASQDPYRYPHTTVLLNTLRFQTQAELDNHEALATASRFADPFPEGSFDIGHYCAIHKHLFQDVFDWAGEYRTVRIGKNRGNINFHSSRLRLTSTSRYYELVGTMDDFRWQNSYQ